MSGQETNTDKQGLVVRQCALDIVTEVLSKKIPLDDVLERHNGFRSLEGRDRAFCRMLVSTVFRRMGQIDDLIRRGLSQKNKKIKPHVLHNVLRLGVAQVVFMNVADHAAVNSTVALAAKNGCFRQKGFVNAVMRGVVREFEVWVSAQDEGRLCSVDWLLKLWIDDYGLKVAGDIANANLGSAALDLTLRSSEDADAWAKRFDGSVLPCGRVRLDADMGSKLTELAGYDEGSWWVQDLSASLPALLFGDVMGRTIVDVCAAPGGKTAQLCDAGARVVAVDRSARRLSRLKENMQRLGFSGQVQDVVADACVWKPSESVDGVLVDAPCSATGTIRRHPDLPHIKDPVDLDGLVQLQAEILDNSYAMLKDDGVLVYCTCSLQKCEGEEQIDAFLSRHPDMKREPITEEELSGLAEVITGQGDVRVLPYYLSDQGGMDGFYIARLRRCA